MTKNTKLKIDDYKQVINCFETAKFIRSKLLLGESIALPMSLNNGTLFHMSFVPLWRSVPDNVIYSDGFNNGFQFNIDRGRSYTLAVDSKIGETSYIIEKWGVLQGDAEKLLPLFNSILTGEDYYKKT